MAKQTQIQTLVSHIYGPYRDSVILKDDFPRQGVTLPIREVQMYSNNAAVGFDDTEFIGQPPIGSRSSKNEHVVFFGILEISSLEWLSDCGLEYLEKDLQEYDEKVHMDHLRSGLTLRTLYGQRKGEGSRIKVRICCDRNLNAHFLTTKTDPEKLIIYSIYEGRPRRFWVQSMHVSTFQSSRNFLDRYRLRALIQELIDTDTDKTPLEKRDIDWLISRYLAVIHPRDAENRIISDPEIDFDLSREPRAIRHLAKARIRGYFASQAEWLLAHMIVTTSNAVKLVDAEKWIQFCRQANLDSIEAKKNGVRWGVPHGRIADSKGPYNLARNLAKFGHNEEYWAKKLQNVRARKSKANKVPNRELSPEIDLPNDHPSSFIQFQYDSDFSEPSTPEVSDSEPEPSPIRVPYFCLMPPQIPNGRFTWNCQGCRYQIDLLKLSQENLDLLPEDTSRVLTGKSWRVGDEPVQRALFMMVSKHFQDHHVAANGVRVALFSGNKWHLETIQPAEKNKQKFAGKIKREDNDNGMDQLRRSSRKPRPRRLDS